MPNRSINLSATKLGYLFQEGDREWRHRRLTQYFVVKTAKTSPVLAAGIYRHLIRMSGEHAAELFYTLLQSSDFFLWYHLVNLTRPNPKLPD